MGSSLGSSDSVAGHLVTLKFYKNNHNNHLVIILLLLFFKILRVLSDQLHYRKNLKKYLYNFLLINKYIV